MVEGEDRTFIPAHTCSTCIREALIAFLTIDPSLSSTIVGMIGAVKSKPHVSFPLLGAVRRNALGSSAKVCRLGLLYGPWRSCLSGFNLFGEHFHTEAMLTSTSTIDAFLY